MAESKQERDERIQAEKEFRIQFLVKKTASPRPRPAAFSR